MRMVLAAMALAKWELAFRWFLKALSLLKILKPAKITRAFSTPTGKCDVGVATSKEISVSDLQYQWVTIMEKLQMHYHLSIWAPGERHWRSVSAIQRRVLS